MSNLVQISQTGFDKLKEELSELEKNGQRSVKELQMLVNMAI